MPYITNNAAFSSTFHARYKISMDLAQKRKLQKENSKVQTVPQKVPKGLSVLADCGINYDEPLKPMTIASNRQERIQREKQKSQPSTAQTIQFAVNFSAVYSAQVPTQTVVQVAAEHPSGQQQSTVTVTGAANLIPHQAQAVIASLTQVQQLQTSKHTPSVPNSQSYTNSQSQHVYNQNSPVHTQSSGGSPGVRSPSSTTPQASQPFDIYRARAIDFVEKIKNRFQGQPDIYKHFLEILVTYQKEQRNLKDGVHSGTKQLTKADVYAQVAKLFQNQDDLLEEWGQYLPNASGAANALVGLKPPKPINNENGSVKKPSAPVKPITPTNNQSKQIQGIKHPAPSVLSSPIKKKQKSYNED